MLDKFKDSMKQLQMMQKMMKDENFRAFLGHPKMRELIKDPEFMEAMKSQDMSKLAAHPKFSALMRDPELLALIQKVDMKKLMGS